jgi:hypothetical protein
MRDTEQRFQCLTDRFAVLEKNLRECVDPEQRKDLLSAMLIVIVNEELDELILNNLSRLNSKFARTAAPNPPLNKAAHR